ncbi:MAG: UTP-glucose-1-phosphate uridylyltransferase [Microgenomates group bacterium Gr01-1014_7]|nr:MAG: UTP-glucose-1-phosphate uridylyltransferase [Microgenomates group bacterium Gr01-1014_7]
MAKKITKALIPAAGFGTRFLPQTKAMPKEMMPLVDKPIIQRVVEELVTAGIETIVIVTGWNKRSIEDHFDNNAELEDKLEKMGKTDALVMVRKISDLAEFVYIRQKGPDGNATPILNAKHIMRDDPFLVFWGDDFVDATPSRAKQMIEAYEKYDSTILGSMKARNDEDYKKYGFAGGEEVNGHVIKVQKIIEKPGSREISPSDMAIVSGYLYTPDIYEHLEKAIPNLKEGEELVYTLGLQGMIDDGISVHAVELQNAIFRDTGNKFEYMKTVVDLALEHPEINGEFREYLKSLMNESQS